MAIYRVRFGASARREFAKLPPPMKVRVGRAIDELARQPRPAGAQLLSGSANATWRIRVGDYRVLYEILGDDLIVLVLGVGHRREVYRRRRIGEAGAPYEGASDRPSAHGGRSWTSQLRS